MESLRPSLGPKGEEVNESYDAFCECDIDGYSSFYSSAIRKARKQHQCSECFSIILPGESYEYASGKQEGEMWDAKTCSTCLELVNYIKAHVPCYCRMHGDLFEDRLRSLVEEATQTPGFAFGILRRVVACNARRYGQCQTNVEAK